VNRATALWAVTRAVVAAIRSGVEPEAILSAVRAAIDAA
jgi:hypothetical protein